MKHSHKSFGRGKPYVLPSVRRRRRQAFNAAVSLIALAVLLGAICYALGRLPCNHYSELAADVHGFLTLFSGMGSFGALIVALIAATEA